MAEVTATSVAGVRHFNRFYTRQIGVLREGLLGSSLSLTEVRVLYELAHREEATATELCGELGIDPGYLSRIVRGFQKRGWLRRRKATDDARRQHLSLTREGEASFQLLNDRSSDEIRALLAPLPPGARGRLLDAMRDIERLLRPDEAAAAWRLRTHQPGDIGWIVHRHGVLYWDEWRYDERFEALVARIVADFVDHLDPSRERCWIAEREGERLGSVMLVQRSKQVAKLRLLLVEPSARGLGIGRALVDACIAFARSCGYRKIVLWTQSELKAARAIYQRAGFTRVGSEPNPSWGRDDLVSETWELAL